MSDLTLLTVAVSGQSEIAFFHARLPTGQVGHSEYFRFTFSMHHYRGQLLNSDPVILQIAPSCLSDTHKATVVMDIHSAQSPDAIIQLPSLG